MDSYLRASSEQNTSIHSGTHSRKAASFSETVLAIESSPPLTSSLHSRNSASSKQESDYLRQAWWLRMTRVVISLFSVGTGTAILGCEGHALRDYNVTHLNSGWHLPLWPANIDLKPTLGVLIPAAIITGFSFVYLIIAIIPSPHSRTKQLNILFGITTVISFLVSLFSTIYQPVLIFDVDPFHKPVPRPSLQTFTCNLYRSAEDFMSTSKSLQLPVFAKVNYPTGFKRICMESEAGYGLMIALLLLQVIALVVAGFGLWADRRMKKVREDRYRNLGQVGNFVEKNDWPLVNGQL